MRKPELLRQVEHSRISIASYHRLTLCAVRSSLRAAKAFTRYAVAGASTLNINLSMSSAATVKPGVAAGICNGFPGAVG